MSRVIHSFSLLLLFCINRCKCKKCRVVSPKMANYDRVCCNEIAEALGKLKADSQKCDCISRHSQFEKQVLKFGALKRGNPSILKEVKKLSDKEKFKKCKESFLRWLFNCPVSPHEMVVPACVIYKMQKVLVPSAGPLWFDGTFLAVKEECRLGRHCANAKRVQW